MPEKATVARAKKALREGKKPTTAAGEFVREEIHHVRSGKHGAASRQQAVAIGLSKARKAGVPLGGAKKKARSTEVAPTAGGAKKRARSTGTTPTAGGAKKKARSTGAAPTAGGAKKKPRATGAARKPGGAKKKARTAGGTSRAT
jgi:hypothetical protein